MRVSTYTDEFDSHPQSVETAWDAFSAALATHDFSKRAKRGLPCFGPAEFRPDAPSKQKVHVLRVHFGVLDLDDISDADLERVLASCAGLAHVFYTSWSHPEVRASSGLSRLRLVVPFSRAVERHEWPVFWPRMVARLGGVCDPKCKNEDRLYYGPFSPPGSEDVATSHVGEGDPLNVDLLLAAPAPVAPVAASRKARPVSRDKLEALAARWRKARSEARKDLGEALLKLVKGEPYAEPGDRDETLFRVLSALAEKMPYADPESIAEAFKQSLDICGDDPEKDRQKVIEKFNRAVATLEGRQLPAVLITDDVIKVTDDATAALARAGDIYRQGNALVRVLRDSSHILEGAKVSIQIAAFATVRESLSRGAKWIQGDTACIPPQWVIDSVMNRGDWPQLKSLVGIAESPSMRRDGSILDMPGYDVASGILYEPNASYPPVPEHPTLAQLQHAVETIEEVLYDFRFEQPAHKAGFIAAVLTPLARGAFDGPAPMFLFDASTPGSGKGLLAKVAALISIGRYASTSPLAREEVERKKTITAFAMSGDRIVCWDNVVGRLGGENLCAALTEPDWSDRVLGMSRKWSGPMRIVFYATANNCQLGSDMDRRIVHVRIDPGCARPERRSGWRHADLLAHVRRNRPALTVAALTILRAYVAAGRPSMHYEPWGSYEGWSSLVVAALRFAGFADPGVGRDALCEADPELEHMQALVAGWGKLCASKGALALPVRDAISALWPPGRLWERPFPRMAEAVEAMLHLAPNEVPSAHKLGNLLRRVAGRRFEGGRMSSRLDPETNTKLWFLIGSAGTSVPLSPAAGTSGTSS